MINVYWIPFYYPLHITGVPSHAGLPDLKPNIFIAGARP